MLHIGPLKLSENACCTPLLYLWYSQSQGDASQQKQVAVDPVHQFVYAAIWVDVLPCFGVL